MASTTENVKLGVCSVLFDGVNLGFTKGGVEVEVATTTHEVKVDQFGETPISELITGRTVSASVPLAETTLENLVQIMPGSTLITDGVKGTGTITLATAVPVAGDSVTIAGATFTFRATPVAQNDVKIGATFTASAVNLAAAINASDLGYVATVAGAVITVTAKASGAGWNATVTRAFATTANCTVTNIAGGVDATSARVVVSSGINVNLLSVAKTLVLRPRGTFGEDDFIIHRAACPGALSFAYSTENERVFQASFKGFALSDGSLFTVGRAA
jgi:hypothetical protein